MKTVHINHEDLYVSVTDGSSVVMFQDRPDRLYSMSEPTLRSDGVVEFKVIIANIDAEIHTGRP